jgi:spore coat protein U-like protein
MSIARRLAAALALAACLLASLPHPARAYTGTCKVTATAITFGSFNPLLGGNVLANGTITMTCGANSGNGYYDVVLSAGGSGNYQARQMKSGSNSLSYNLYSDSAHTKVWQPDNCGGNCGVMGFSNTSVNGGTMTFTVYGEIPAQPKAIPGTYGDSIMVTLTY